MAQGETQFGRIQQLTGIERGSLSFALSRLLELEWLRREFPFEETSERRALYRVGDPFLGFWYRFVLPLRSVLAFRDAEVVWSERIVPQLSQYLGEQIFEGVCHQWLQKHAYSALGLSLESSGRWWSRDGQTEVDILARCTGGGYLLGECKWSAGSKIGPKVYFDLLAKESRLPESRWQSNSRYVLFSLGGFSPELEALAASVENRLHLVGPERLLSE